MAESAAEGVIKYRSQHVAGFVPSSHELEQLNCARSTLFDLGLIGVSAQGIGYGNVSVRTEGDQFVISGSATGSLRVLTLAHYCHVTSFSMDDNSVCSSGALDASSESMTHGAIYAANSRVRCVIHVHSRSLFAALLGQHALHTAADVAYGTPSMARAVSRLVTLQSELPVIFAMTGHDEGVVAYGADVALVQGLLIDSFERSISHDQDWHHRRQRP